MQWLRPLLGKQRASGYSRRQSFRPSLEGLENRLQPAGLVGLGAASGFGVLEINGGTLTLNSSHLVGDVGLGPNGTSVLQKTDVTGTFFADPSAKVDRSNYGGDFTVTGGIVTQPLGQAQDDANAASTAYAGLTPTQSFGNLTNSTTVFGNGDTNVIALGSLNYNSRTLTLSGGASDVFVFNVSGGFTFADSKIVLVGGVTADHVVFNFPTTGPVVKLSKSTNVVNATILAPNRDVVYHNPAAFTGAIIGHNITIHSDANLNSKPFNPPDESSSLSGFVYVDGNQNGVKDDGEEAIPGVLITLQGTDDQGMAVFATAVTDASGAYSFTSLRPGTYSLQESQPLGFLDGQDSIGTQGGQVDDAADLLFSIVLNKGVNGLNNNFGELRPGGDS